VSGIALIICRQDQCRWRGRWSTQRTSKADGSDVATSIAVFFGQRILTGTTSSTDFPSERGAYQRTPAEASLPAECRGIALLGSTYVSEQSRRHPASMRQATRTSLETPPRILFNYTRRVPAIAEGMETRCVEARSDPAALPRFTATILGGGLADSGTRDRCRCSRHAYITGQRARSEDRHRFRSKSAGAFPTTPGATDIRAPHGSSRSN